MTAEQLITEVRQLAQLADVDSADLSNPTAEADSDEGILNIANREMRGKLLSDVMSLREEFFVLKQDYAITTASDSYRIPSRAVGAKLRDVVYVDSASNATGLPRLKPEDVVEQYRFGFIVQGNSIVLRTQDSSGTLRLSYFARPGKLVKAAYVGTVESINTTTKAVTLTADKSAVFGSGGATVVVDIQKAGSPFEYVAVGSSVTATLATKTVLTFSSLPSGLAVGDSVALEDTSNYVQLPEEAASVLAYRTAAKSLEAIGDEGGTKRLSESASEMEEAMRVLLTPRVDGRPQKISNKKLLGSGWWRV